MQENSGQRQLLAHLLYWGEVHLPLYWRGVWLVFGDHRLMRMKKGIYCSRDPQYGGWIGDRRAVGDARTTNMTSL
jgi:hypothetical protein